MLATYGVDVLDPEVSLRRIHVLASRLPAGSTPTADNMAAWSTEAHLLARLNDAVDLLTWVTLRAAGSKSARRPKTLARPGPRPAGPGGRRVRWGQLAETLRGEGAVIRG